MLTFQSLLLAAVCLCSRAAPLETPERPGDDKDSSLLKDRTRTHSFSNSSLLSSQNPKTTQTSAAPAQNGGDEEGAVGIHEGRVTADGNERRTYGHTTESLPWSSADTLQLGAADEDSRLRADALTSGDSTGPRLLDAADTWTEPVHLRAEGVSVLPSSPEVGTDATMSSEDLPLIFEPFEDVTPPSRVSVTTATAAVMAGDTEQTVSMDTQHTSSDVRLSGTLDWQTSGLRASVTESEQNDDVTRSSVTHQALTVVLVPASEDLESKEEPEEDEEDSDEEEEESEEDLMESTMAPHTRPPYSLIPPPPVWVQRNQGLVRSWVELIREKAGYVSGMLAPVGIGIAGALLLVGALYSIRLIHRKRRDSFKHQRRKPPREVWSGPDNAMLLADSSEDEF